MPDAGEQALITADEFAALMATLGPYEPRPRLAAGVSGGADSMALALLADAWVRQRGGELLALVVDHGLRRESAEEAAVTVARLAARGIAARLLTIGGLVRGPALAERARGARFGILERTCAEAGILHLLLGHHADDQAETLMIRALSGSGIAGFAGMAALVERMQVRVLRPLLGVPPVRLRAFLVAAGMAWVEDPSNVDRAALRARLRLLRLAGGEHASGSAALASAAAAAGRQRAAQDRAIAACLADQVTLRPEGFALVAGRWIAPAALAALLQVISGAPYLPSTRSVASLAAALRPATLSGARLFPARRLGEGMLLVREAAAMAAPVAAAPGVVWDRRFRLGVGASMVAGATLGGLGDDAAGLRRRSPLPSAVLRTLPAIRLGSALLAVPHLLYPDCRTCERFPVLYSPPRPAAAAPFEYGDAGRVATPYV